VAGWLVRNEAVLEKIMINFLIIVFSALLVSALLYSLSSSRFVQKLLEKISKLRDKNDKSEQGKVPVLRPCPFCGGMAEITEHRDGTFSIECENECVSTIRGMNRKRAVQTWNTRSNDYWGVGTPSEIGWYWVMVKSAEGEITYEVDYFMSTGTFKLHSDVISWMKMSDTAKLEQRVKA